MWGRAFHGADIALRGGCGGSDGFVLFGFSFCLFGWLVGLVFLDEKIMRPYFLIFYFFLREGIVSLLLSCKLTIYILYTVYILGSEFLLLFCFYTFKEKLNFFFPTTFAV